MTEACAEEFARELEARPIPPAAYIVESLICCGGQVVLPDGYLKQMHGLVRAHGGLAIADEVQTGFGRIGSHMWAFESQDATPDIVTVGKPFGNGFPLAAVVTTREVAEASARIEYFNTFGGNPVACAVGLEVLQVVGDERLQEHALHTGRATRALLEELALKQPSIGDVRGMGLLLGVELVKDRTTREPDPDAASFAMQWMRSYQNVLVSTDGPHRNVIKVKPPMKFTVDDGKTLTAALDAALDAFARAKR
jgi:4-aminobutyrate aminotransferase-like enzyme